ncbi:Metallo-hydrolase/oxidoreductase [Roridomyces roridus]|uniref:Metallo-hydrolase/oxidoreductase n=1 Tax=Roridomyces roridus TaxID=1738132 RepID=A0AAD7BC99_9AGAR|nr:Metallo-hydrolase/oxidoreductase [Roridomyces roridus]
MTEYLKSTESAPSLPAPAADQPYMVVSALQAGFIDIPLDLAVQGEARTHRKCPSLAFYVKHSASDKHFIFDLGLRRDWGSYPPMIQKHLGQLMPCEVPQSVEESCIKGGLDPASIKNIVISHLHFDHIGDHTPFKNATFTIGGEGKSHLTDGYPGNPDSLYLADSTPRERTTFLSMSDFATSIGPFPYAHDFYGDGSVYIIHTPGHCEGHVNVLARTSADGSWIYLGGDLAHDTRLITDPNVAIATTAENGKPFCMHRDPVQARIDIGRVKALVKMPRVECVLAHDWKWAEDNKDTAFLPGKIVPK